MEWARLLAVVLSFFYLLVHRTFGLLGLARSDAIAKDAEILVLRHQVAALRRQVGRARFTWSDRALIALPAGRIPRQRWTAYLVTPKTGRPFGAAVGAGDGEPTSGAEISVGSDAVDRREDTLADLLDREVGDRAVARFVEQDRIFTLGDPHVVEADPHAAAGRLDEQQPVGQGLIGEEVPDGAWCDWSLSPG